MGSKYLLWKFFLLIFIMPLMSASQVTEMADKYNGIETTGAVPIEFYQTAAFLDAALNSLNTFNSLVKKESYRLKVTSFNNPASSNMGFSLESEINAALKPLLAKAKNISPGKFTDIITGVVNSQGRMPYAQGGLVSMSPVFSTIMSIVGTLTIQEKRITREDLDSFSMGLSRYFVLFQKLNEANLDFDKHMEKLSSGLKDLQFDMRQFMFDLVIVVNRNVRRSQLDSLKNEEIFLHYLDREPLNTNGGIPDAFLRYPSDGIKTAKEITGTLQKLWEDYQLIYASNYQQIRSVLLESRSLGKKVNTNQVDSSLQELELLYNESRLADQLGIRLTTLLNRLRILVSTEQKRIQ